MAKPWLEEILEKNEAYCKTPEATQFSLELRPGRMAVFTCMDPRVSIKAIGGDRPYEDGSVLRVVLNAGGYPDYRSAIPLLYLAELKEYAIMAHTDCGMTKIGAKIDVIFQRMKERLGEDGFRRFVEFIGEPFEEKFREWLGTFEDPYEKVREMVKDFKNHPVVPPDVIVHGLVQDILTGKVEVVVNGYEEAEGDK